MPYMRNRARCQIWMNRTLRANDNLMQLCVHGGTLKYGEGESAEAAAKNPMAADAEVDEAALAAAAEKAAHGMADDI